MGDDGVSIVVASPVPNITPLPWELGGVANAEADCAQSKLAAAGGRDANNGALGFVSEMQQRQQHERQSCESRGRENERPAPDLVGERADERGQHDNNDTVRDGTGQRRSGRQIVNFAMPSATS